MSDPDVVREKVVTNESIRRLLGVRLGRHRMYPPRPLEPLHVDAGGREPDPGLRFAIVTPVLDQAAFIEPAIRSVGAQHYANLDYLVKDGGSSDGTVEKAIQVCAGIGRVVSGPDSGLANALNQGFALVDGDIVGWLNGDDVLLPGTLRYVARYFSNHDDVDVVYGHRIIIDSEGDEVGRWLLPPHDDRVLSFADYVPQETLFWRRELWQSVGARIDESFRFAVDWDLLLRFRDAGAKFARLPRFLGAFRVHPAQKSAREMTSVGREEKVRLWQRTLGRVPSRWELAMGTGGYLARHAVLSAIDRLRS